MKLFYDEPMARHTTLRVGGPADRFIVAGTGAELARAVALCRREEVPFAVIGRGSNLLFSDAGFRGTIIALRAAAESAPDGCPEEAVREIPACDAEEAVKAQEHRESPGLRIEEENADSAVLYASGGVALTALASFAMDRGLTGLEFAGGIPGTVGGGIRMNAGAYGGELADVTVAVRVLTADGSFLERGAEEMTFGYRHSAIQESGEIVTGAFFSLKRGDRGEIAERMAELLQRRREKQPLEFPSAGSTWRRPEGYYAAKLIEEAGCKGLSVGDAQISEKHAGFLINRGHATAADIRTLMHTVEQRVFETSGVRLRPEVEMLGFGDSGT